MRLGLVIDLTKTSRFYDKREVEKAGIKHVKMQCEGSVKKDLMNIYYSLIILNINYFNVINY